MAGYAVCVVLAIPLVVLGLSFARLLGPVGLTVAVAVTGLGVAVAWTARRRDERRQDLHRA